MNTTRSIRGGRSLWATAMALSLASFLGAQALPPPGPPPGAQGPPPGRQAGPGPRRGGPPAPANAREAAPVDLTGNWVSVITEDWRFRMMTGLKGEVTGVPVTPSARAAAEAWDPAKDEAAGLQCKAYGAPFLMRLPGRALISWQDDNTLKIEYDTGEQTRLLHFGGQRPTDVEPSWQGYSVAEWERDMVSVSGAGVRGGLGGGRAFGPPVALTGSLKVVTTGLRPGYLRRNGVPYSSNAVLTEYVNHRVLPSGDTWLTVVAVVEDPENLTGPLVVSSDFKKEPDGSKRMPMPCSVK